MIQFVVSFYDCLTKQVYTTSIESSSSAFVVEEVQRIANGKAIILSIYAPEFDEFYELEGGDGCG